MQSSRRPTIPHQQGALKLGWFSIRNPTAHHSHVEPAPGDASSSSKQGSEPAITMTRTCTGDTAQPGGAIAPYRHPVPGGRSPGRTIRSIGVGAVLVLLAGTTVACGSGNTTTSSSAASSSSPPSSASKSAAATSGSTTYPAGKEQICQARDQLKTSITTLTDQGLLTAGTTAI